LVPQQAAQMVCPSAGHERLPFRAEQSGQVWADILTISIDFPVTELMAEGAADYESVTTIISILQG
jgi:hypothetical protein